MLQQYDYFVYCFTPMYLLSMLYFNGILRNTVIIMLIGSGDGKEGGGGTIPSCLVPILTNSL